jgi:antitoxin CcdA
MRIWDTHVKSASMRSGARGRKAPTNLSVRADLVREAKALRLNLSDLLERALEHAIRDRQRDAWLAQNRKAIRAYNADVEKRGGVFSDDWRRF